MRNLKNKGKFLETLLNITNEKYLSEDVAIITKIENNINLISSHNNIINANFKSNFNCDYVGVYNGMYLEFEAKETSKDFFSYSLLRKNQIEKMRLVDKHKGVSFIIIYFEFKNKYFMCSFKNIESYFNDFSKKIPYIWFEENAYEIFIDSSLKLDYLKLIHLLFN